MISRDEAAGLLGEYGDGAAWMAHCTAVADGAERVGALLSSRRAIDLDALWSSALLHDIGRCVTHDPIMHGVEGYNLLMRLGHSDAAFVCASHVLFGLNAADAALFGLPAREFMPRTLGERIVPLVDFLIEGHRCTTLDDRFASLRQRNAGNDAFLLRLDSARDAASAFMAELDREIGRPVAEVLALDDGVPSEDIQPSAGR